MEQLVLRPQAVLDHDPMNMNQTSSKEDSVGILAGHSSHSTQESLFIQSKASYPGHVTVRSCQWVYKILSLSLYIFIYHIYVYIYRTTNLTHVNVLCPKWQVFICFQIIRYSTNKSITVMYQSEKSNDWIVQNWNMLPSNSGQRIRGFSPCCWPGSYGFRCSFLCGSHASSDSRTSSVTWVKNLPRYSMWSYCEVIIVDFFQDFQRGG